VLICGGGAEGPCEAEIGIRRSNTTEAPISAVLVPSTYCVIPRASVWVRRLVEYCVWFEAKLRGRLTREEQVQALPCTVMRCARSMRDGMTGVPVSSPQIYICECFRDMSPPVYTTTGSALTALSTPSVHVTVAQPAFAWMNPAQIGPTMQPAAHAVLKSPYACAYAPDAPKSPGRCFSFATTTYVNSAMSGVMLTAIQVPIRKRSAQRSTFCPIVSCVTRRRRIQNGNDATNPIVAGHRGPYLSESRPGGPSQRHSSERR
jgi:hypothetical protein